MADPKDQAAKQLANIQASTGKSVADFAAAIAAAGLEKHGQMVQFLKREFSLGHGNANLIAHTVRAAEAPAQTSDDLLAAQYAGRKAPLRAIYDRLAPLAQAAGPDVQVVVQKTGVSFRAAKQFALIQAPSSKRVTLGLNLDATPDPRVAPTKGMCTHQAVFTAPEQVDGDVSAWLAAAYARAAK